MATLRGIKSLGLASLGLTFSIGQVFAQQDLPKACIDAIADETEEIAKSYEPMKYCMDNVGRLGSRFQCEGVALLFELKLEQSENSSIRYYCPGSVYQRYRLMLLDFRDKFREFGSR